jgi:hypothetical protein
VGSFARFRSMRTDGKTAQVAMIEPRRLARIAGTVRSLLQQRVCSMLAAIDRFVIARLRKCCNACGGPSTINPLDAPTPATSGSIAALTDFRIAKDATARILPPAIMTLNCQSANNSRSPGKGVGELPISSRRIEAAGRQSMPASAPRLTSLESFRQV